MTDLGLVFISVNEFVQSTFKEENCGKHHGCFEGGEADWVGSDPGNNGQVPEY